MFNLEEGVVYSQGVRDEIAHEFMHILTPLNLHSNIIQPFNFIVPTCLRNIFGFMKG